MACKEQRNHEQSCKFKNLVLKYRFIYLYILQTGCVSLDLAIGLSKTGRSWMTNVTSYKNSDHGFRIKNYSACRNRHLLIKPDEWEKEHRYHIISTYAPQTGYSNQDEDEFWRLLQQETAEVVGKTPKGKFSVGLPKLKLCSNKISTISNRRGDEILSVKSKQ
ncbi:hypothetical protein LOAG_01830 [Loa loa]|uniref:Uncharacterized protein n=1 Tax=Loa loa TaxID=7209 RepID=A0A1S0U8T9_LOALO|nr:hypothetical protein LOAG_01830 [Loa loa]EFO26650.1 hypothetical protein LOAG_01830 [Loa loa]